MKVIVDQLKNLSIRSYIALIIVVGSFAFLFCLQYHKTPQESKDILQIATGLVLAALGTVVAYYFGASKDKSDAEKDERDQSKQA